MAKGIKTGGRKKGTPNKRTEDIVSRLEQLKCDPIEGLVRIAKAAEKEQDKVLAAGIYKDLLPYVAPKRKSVEHELAKNSFGDDLREALLAD